MEKEVNGIKIIVPEGMEIDKENSTFEYIKFKKKEEVAWRNKKENCISGFYINSYAEIGKIEGFIYGKDVYNVFATEKQAKSALAMAQISQIMANDARFGGVVTDEEWDNLDIEKWVIDRFCNQLNCPVVDSDYRFLAFHTQEQRDLFLKENEDLVKQYLMID